MENTEVKQKKSKKGLILGIGICLVVVLIVVGVFAGISAYKEGQYKKAMQLLDDGDFLEAIEIHEKLGDYNGLAQKISDAADDEAKKLLKKDNYKKVAKLYANVAAYPDAVEMIGDRLENKMEDLFEDWNADGIEEMLSHFADIEEVNTLLHAAMDDAVLDLWDENFDDCIYLYRQLKEKDIQINAASLKISEYILQKLEEKDGYNAFRYLPDIKDHEQAMAEVTEAVIESANEAVASEDYNWLDDLHSYLERAYYHIDQLDDIIYDCAISVLDKGDYHNARTILRIIDDCRSLITELEDAEILELLETMQGYIDRGNYSKARNMLDRYVGRKLEKLLELYLTCCGDSTFLEDLAKALQARENAVAESDDYQLAIDAEMAYLEKYSSIPFYDETLGDLANAYISGLYAQRNALEDYSYDGDYYSFYYRWNMGAADRYDALTALNSNYGFGAGDDLVESLVGTGEDLRNWMQAWYEIHDCLSWYLWNQSASWDGSEYYLEFYNYTSYTFSVTIYMDFTDGDNNVLTSDISEYLAVAPGETVRVPVLFPEVDWYNWYIDWDIYDIYLNDEPLG